VADPRRGHPGHESTWRPNAPGTGVPLPPAPSVESAAQPIVVAGNGWRLTVPAVLLSALLSGLGARFIPTATTTDTELAGMRQDLRELRAELAQRGREQDAKLETIRTELSAERNMNLIQNYQLQELRNR
jgi:hypothetical protein